MFGSAGREKTVEKKPGPRRRGFETRSFYKHHLKEHEITCGVNPKPNCHLCGGHFARLRDHKCPAKGEKEKQGSSKERIDLPQGSLVL